MKPAWELFDRGDKVAARRLAQTILRAPSTPRDAEEANELLERTRAPKQVWLIAVGAGVVLVLLWLLAAHRGAMTG